MKPERFNGSNSCTPAYFRIWNGETTSLNEIREENPNMVEAFMVIAAQLALVGQRTLPIFGESDVIYQPIPKADNRQRTYEEVYIEAVDIHMDRVRRGALPPVPKVLDYRNLEQ